MGGVPAVCELARADDTLGSCVDLIENGFRDLLAHACRAPHAARGVHRPRRPPS
jgi:hypothetical protein